MHCSPAELLCRKLQLMLPLFGKRGQDEERDPEKMVAPLHCGVGSLSFPQNQRKGAKGRGVSGTSISAAIQAGTPPSCSLGRDAAAFFFESGTDLPSRGLRRLSAKAPSSPSCRFLLPKYSPPGLPCSAWTRWQKTKSTPRSMTALERGPRPAAASALLRSGHRRRGQAPAASSPRRRTPGSRLWATPAVVPAASSQRAICGGAARLTHPSRGSAPARRSLGALGCPWLLSRPLLLLLFQGASSRQCRYCFPAAGVKAVERRRRRRQQPPSELLARSTRCWPCPPPPCQ